MQTKRAFRSEMPVLHADGHRIIIPDHAVFISALITMGFRVDPDPSTTVDLDHAEEKDHE